MHEPVTRERVAWSIVEISKATGLSAGFLRAEVRRGKLPIRRFGRRVLILAEDLRNYLKGDGEAKTVRRQG